MYVYTGADGAFTLYNDQGSTYDYEHGTHAEIPIRFNDATGTLSIGARHGHFAGMPATRTFKIRWIDGPMPKASNADAPVARTVVYKGKKILIKRTRATQ